MKNNDMVTIYVLGALFILMVLFGGCAGGPISTSERVHERHVLYHLYSSGECVSVGLSLYAINKGVHLALYDDYRCTQKTTSWRCDEIKESESCFIGNRVFFVEGRDNYMTLHVLEY